MKIQISNSDKVLKELKYMKHEDCDGYGDGKYYAIWWDNKKIGVLNIDLFWLKEILNEK